MHPEARKERLLTEVVGDELVVYDQHSHQAHRLNDTAKIVWHLADGHRSIESIARALRERLGPTRGELGEAECEALVRLALRELARADLLVATTPAYLAGAPASRRHVLTAAAAAVVPVIASIVAPVPAAAQSTPTSPPPMPDPTPMPPAVDSFNGTYVGTGTLRPQAQPGTCIDDNFPEMVNLRGVLALNSGAPNPWIKTHLPDTVYAFPNPQATVFVDSLRLTATGTFAPDDFFNYTAMESYLITGNDLAGTQTFSLSVCTWIYDVEMTRQ